MDLISELPKEVKHRIIYFLSAEGAARTSSLSKPWKSAWDSRPVVDFDEHCFSDHGFAQFLDQSRQRFTAGGTVSVETLRLTMRTGRCNRETKDAVRRWVLFAAATNRLTEVKIHYDNFHSNDNEDLLHALSSRALTTLSLSGRKLTRNPAGGDWPELPLLRSLTLEKMILESAAVEGLVSACPSLESFTLLGSKGLKGLEFSHQKLRRVKVDSVSISLLHASSLESFIYLGKYMHSAPEIDLQGCEESLKELRLSNIHFAGDWLQSQVYKFGRLEVLALVNIQSAESFRISTTELTEFVLKYLPDAAAAVDLVNKEIYAPNLRILDYRLHDFPFCKSFVASRSLEKVNLEFWLEKAANHKTACFDKLKELSDKISHINNVVVCIICHGYKIAIVHEGLSDDLIRILCELDNSVLSAQVIISSDSNWERHVVSPYKAHSIYIVSSFHNNDNNLSKNLSRKLTEVQRSSNDFSYEEDSNSLPDNIITHLRCFRIETRSSWSGFRCDYYTKQALLKAYVGVSSLRLTRFFLNW